MTKEQLVDLLLQTEQELLTVGHSDGTCTLEIDFESDLHMMCEVVFDEVLTCKCLHGFKYDLSTNTCVKRTNNINSCDLQQCSTSKRNQDDVVCSCGVGEQWDKKADKCTAVQLGGTEVLQLQHGNTNGSMFGEVERIHDLPNDEPFIDVAVSQSHSLVVTESGTVFSWGQNDAGQLGLGVVDKGQSTPQRVHTLVGTRIAKVAATKLHSLALTRDGLVYAWGNARGLFPDDVVNNVVSIPTQIAQLSNIVQIAVGNAHFLAVTRKGKLFSWGKNDVGQLGIGKVSKRKTKPIEVPLSNVVAVAAAAEYTLALTDDGVVHMMGALVLTGQPESIQPTPLPALGLPAFQSIATASTYALLITRSNQVFGWGEGAGLGPATQDGPLFTPKELPALGPGATHAVVSDKFSIVEFLDSEPVALGEQKMDQGQVAIVGPAALPGIPPHSAISCAGRVCLFLAPSIP
eukprot:TRINITY_DN65686_c9_g1_i1.p1 TRINITY_DN65686_c9_g1~~TRINITY_DN65686_c9_g1_i1.p1  ORF type:complete len:503 (+),score=31.66 TRINITY_DN65686_c9_g1_i1:129-1511(+)